MPKPKRDSKPKKTPRPEPEGDESVEEIEVDSESDDDVAKSDSEIEDCIDEDADEDGDDEDDLNETEEEAVPQKRSSRRSKVDEDIEGSIGNKADKISNLIQKVFIAHKSIGNVAWDHFETVQLAHPRTKSPALFLLHMANSDTNEEENGDKLLEKDFFLYEVLTMDQDTRSWFIGENVISDGNTYTFTPMDPLFLIASAMSKSTQARPLLDHLEELFPRKVGKVLTRRLSVKQLENISIRKAAGDIEAYAFSESNTLAWLAGKVSKVAEFFRKKNITSSESSVSINFTKASDPSESKEFLRYAAETVCEYVNDDLQAKLFEKLGLPMVRPKRKVDNDDDSANKKLKTVDNIQPLEDYGSAVKSTPQGGVKGGRGKAKAAEFEKAAKGTHLLSKFFQVKPKS